MFGYPNWGREVTAAIGAVELSGAMSDILKGKGGTCILIDGGIGLGVVARASISRAEDRPLSEYDSNVTRFESSGRGVPGCGSPGIVGTALN